MFKKHDWMILEERKYTIYPFVVYKNFGTIFNDWWYDSSFASYEEAEAYIAERKDGNKVWYF